MKDISLSQLLHQDFDIRNIVVQEWKFGNYQTNDYRTIPRTHMLIHLITSGQRKYRIRDREFTLSAGTALFIPDATHYYTEPVPSADFVCQGIGATFDLLDTSNEKIYITPDIYHYWNASPHQYDKLFQNLNECALDPCSSILKRKSLMYRLLHNMVSQIADTSPGYHLIEPALRYITAHYSENTPICVYAEQCTLSESYFRKKFAECTGMSPIEYRNKLRFHAARRLYQENRSVQEIAEIVGFCDANYFSKLYKKCNGVSIKNDPEIV